MQRQEYYRGQQFDLRNNLNQSSEQDKLDRKQDGFKVRVDGPRD
jgi:hypothetical protein